MTQPSSQIDTSFISPFALYRFLLHATYFACRLARLLSPLQHIFRLSFSTCASIYTFFFRCISLPLALHVSSAAYNTNCLRLCFIFCVVFVSYHVNFHLKRPLPLVLSLKSVPFQISYYHVCRFSFAWHLHTLHTPPLSQGSLFIIFPDRFQKLLCQNFRPFVFIWSPLTSFSFSPSTLPFKIFLIYCGALFAFLFFCCRSRCSPSQHILSPSQC